MPINRTNLEDDYRELDLKPGASLEEVRTSYRELALFWHPDRRKDGSGRASNAHQRMTRINLAYERLRKALSAKSHSRPGGTARSRSEDQKPRTKNRPPEAESQQQQPREMRANTLGMRFVSVPGTSVLFSIWETRVQDYKAFAAATHGSDDSWTSPGFDSFEHTSPVGSFAANAQWLFDMGGNVWEWCEDFLDGKSGVRVLRGASWNFSSGAHLLSSYRNGVAQTARSNGIGFRIVMVPG